MIITFHIHLLHSTHPIPFQVDTDVHEHLQASVVQKQRNMQGTLGWLSESSLMWVYLLTSKFDIAMSVWDNSRKGRGIAMSVWDNSRKGRGIPHRQGGYPIVKGDMTQQLVSSVLGTKQQTPFLKIVVRGDQMGCNHQHDWANYHTAGNVCSRKFNECVKIKNCGGKSQFHSKGALSHLGENISQSKNFTNVAKSENNEL